MICKTLMRALLVLGRDELVVIIIVVALEHTASLHISHVKLDSVCLGHAQARICAVLTP